MVRMWVKDHLFFREALACFAVDAILPYMIYYIKFSFDDLQIRNCPLLRNLYSGKWQSLKIIKNNVADRVKFE